jgi:hypothetical protein
VVFVQQILQRRPIVFAAVTHVGANLGLGPLGIARRQGLDQLDAGRCRPCKVG